MIKKSLAVKYRPKEFEDVCEQKAVIETFKYLIDHNDFPNSALLCGSAGTGKTTCARIIANKINKGRGRPIEIDAASNNGVDNVRSIIEQSKLRSLDSEYKVFIIDECHALTIQSWQAFLKQLEEPNNRTLYLFCTTDPQKIPATILSRVQRFDFCRITYDTIVKRLKYIMDSEIADGEPYEYDMDAIKYIAKIADGGMRDAITTMDKCLGLNGKLTIQNVIESIGVQNYDSLFTFIKGLLQKDIRSNLEFVNQIYLNGQDIRQFVAQVLQFTVDLCKYRLLKSFDYIKIPQTFEPQLRFITDSEYVAIKKIMIQMIEVKSNIKWETEPKLYLEAELFKMCEG